MVYLKAVGLSWSSGFSRSPSRPAKGALKNNLVFFLTPEGGHNHAIVFAFNFTDEVHGHGRPRSQGSGLYMPVCVLPTATGQPDCPRSPGDQSRLGRARRKTAAVVRWAPGATAWSWRNLDRCKNHRAQSYHHPSRP